MSVPSSKASITLGLWEDGGHWGVGVGDEHSSDHWDGKKPSVYLGSLKYWGKGGTTQ